MEELVLILILAGCSFQHFIAKEMRTIVFENNSHGTVSNILDKNISCLNIITNQQISTYQPFFLKWCNANPDRITKLNCFGSRGSGQYPMVTPFQILALVRFVRVSKNLASGGLPVHMICKINSATEKLNSSNLDMYQGKH